MFLLASVNIALIKAHHEGRVWLWQFVPLYRTSLNETGLLAA